MAGSWVTKQASEVRVGDRVRRKQSELTVHRIDVGFMDRPGYLAFIEDSPERWLKMPSAQDADVEVWITE